MEKNHIECKNCHSVIEDRYCSHCGQSSHVERFSLSKLGGEFLHGFFHVDGGLLFTIKELFVRPGDMLSGYIEGKRIHYFNPFTFLVIASLVGGFVYKRSGIPDHMNEILLASSETIKFTVNHYNYRLLLTIPTYAIACSIFYKSFRYNFAEHLIINTYLISQSMILLMLWMIINLITKPGDLVFEILYFSAFVSAIIYQVIVYFQLFNNGKTIIRWVTATAAVLLGLGLSFVLMNLLMKMM